MRILLEESAALIIDVQERLFPHMHDRENLERSLLTLIQGLKILEVPFLVTQQYTRGLGLTIPSLRQVLGLKTQGGSSGNPIEKVAFSCCDEPAFTRELSSLGRRRILLAGIEAHVCLLQTAIDLLDLDYTPVVIADCTSSRREQSKALAIERMKAEGVLLSTCESILFELCRYAGSETFKAISRLVK